MNSTEQNKNARSNLQSYIERQSDGMLLDWLTIQRETGITMDQRGRSLFRSALKGVGRVGETIRGTGIRLSSKDTAITIVGSGFQSIHNAAKRAHKTHGALSVRHLTAMDPTDQSRMILAGSFLGAIVGNVTDAAKALPEKDLPKADPKIALVR